MPHERISDKIGKKELTRIRNFLDRLKTDTKLMQQLFENPKKTLKREAIDLEKMGISKEKEDAVVSVLLTLVKKFVKGKYRIEVDLSRADVIVNKETETSAWWNFDRSSSSTTAYERATETTRGVAQSTDTGEIYATDSGFIEDVIQDGVSMVIDRINEGPLISDKYMNTIKTRFIESLRQARQR